MDAKNVKIGDKVFVIRRFGSIDTGFDTQIMSYEVKYMGEHNFVPSNFNSLKERYREIPYCLCYKTMEAAKRVIRELNTNVTFVEHNDEYCDVIFDEKNNTEMKEYHNECLECAEAFRYGVPCPDIDGECSYKKIVVKNGN